MPSTLPAEGYNPRSTGVETGAFHGNPCNDRFWRRSGGSSIRYPPMAGSTRKEGERIGPYERVRHLARGGMGAVYVARDVRTGAEVAVKILTEPTAAER